MLREHIELRHAWFLERHQLRVVGNGLGDRILTALFNAEVLTLAAADLELRLVSHPRSFGIQCRVPLAAKWRPISSLLPRPEEDELRGAKWQVVLEYVDRNWWRLVEAASRQSLGR